MENPADDRRSDMLQLPGGSWDGVPGLQKGSLHYEHYKDNQLIMCRDLSANISFRGSWLKSWFSPVGNKALDI